MLKKCKRAMAFLLALTVAVSMFCGTGILTLAEENYSTEAPGEEQQSADDQTEPSIPQSENSQSGTGTEEGDSPESDGTNPAGANETENNDSDNTTDQDSDAESTPAETPEVTEEAATEETTEASAEPTEAAAPAEQSLNVAASDGSTVILSGVLPQGATATAVPVQVTIEGQDVLAAYDITIYDANGNEYQPQNGAIAVQIVSAAVQDAVNADQEISVYHMETAEAAPQEVPSANPIADGVEFQADSFSIYVVTTHKTATYNFYAADRTTVLSTQILSSGETLLEPATPEGTENQTFVGWIDANGNSFDKTSFGKTAAQIAGVSELTVSTITNLYPSFDTVYYVHYMSANTENAAVLYTQKYKSGNTVVTSEVPFVTNVDEALVGWTTTQGSSDVISSEYTVGTSDITLYPVVAKANWITFNSMGGSSVNPVYVLSGNQSNVAVSVSTKAGYDFGGWYTDETCTTPYTDGQLEGNITLYAKWNAKTVNYTIVYWQQNADDDDYSYKENETASGTTGSTTAVNPLNSRYDGFSVSTENPTVQQTIAGDGSTVVNVYYDRNTYSVKFYKQTGWGYQSNWQEITELTITAKYGQDISDKWPSKRTDLTTTYPTNWRVSQNGRTYQTGIQTMPLNGSSFYMYDEDGNYTIRTDYYTENLDGSGYTLDHSDTFKDDKTGWTTSKNDYYDIKGFSVLDENGRLLNNDTSAIGSKASRLWNSNNEYGWKFYYLRNSYTIVFMNGETKVGTKTYKYEADISTAAADMTPTKDGYDFVGWFDNEGCYGDPYDFSGKTMPAANMVLYAGWKLPTYTVTFELNGGEAQTGKENDFKNQTVDKGATATEPSDPVREGFTFAGWTWNGGKPFNFDTEITEDITLEAQWISNEKYQIAYDANGGVDADGNAITETVTDGKQYAIDAEVKLMDVPSGWNSPDKEKTFICWNTAADGSGTNYYPGDVIPMEKGGLTLYAQWAVGRETQIIYNYNGGTDADADDSSKTQRIVTKITPNSNYTVEELGNVTKEGMYFTGWNTAADGTGTAVKPGATIQMDTLERNVLYAQWENCPVVTVIKEVTGNMGDKSKNFSFTYTVKDGDEVIASDVSFTLKDYNTDSSSVEEIKNLKPGYTVTISETGNPKADGYSTTVKVGEKSETADHTSIPIGESDISVIFTNDKDVVLPTGISDDMGAYGAMVLAGLGAAVIFFVPRRRRQ